MARKTKAVKKDPPPWEKVKRSDLTFLGRGGGGGNRIREDNRKLIDAINGLKVDSDEALLLPLPNGEASARGIWGKLRQYRQAGHIPPGTRSRRVDDDEGLAVYVVTPKEKD